MLVVNTIHLDQIYRIRLLLEPLEGAVRQNLSAYWESG
jgi:hypothetical protein